MVWIGRIRSVVRDFIWSRFVFGSDFGPIRGADFGPVRCPKSTPGGY